MLHASVKKQYDKNGYHLFHEPVFSAKKFEALKSIFEDLNKENKRSGTDLMGSPVFLILEMHSYWTF